MEDFSVQNFEARTLPCRMPPSPDDNQPPENAAPEADSAEKYLVLLNENERSLAAYVHTLVDSQEDAEDILQACRLTMWKKFPDFEEGTHFLAWARKIALHQILNHRRSHKRKPSFATDPAIIEAVAEEIDRRPEDFARRTEALHSCIAKLPDAQRRTIQLRYFEECDIDQIAAKTKRTEGAVYRLLSRIRSNLNDCIRNELSRTIP